VLSDAMFQADGNLLFGYTDDSGHWGDVNLVNGRPWPLMKVARRKYRFRILNASMSRSFNIEMDSGDNFTVIGSDGGLMPTPQKIRRIKIGSGERYEVVVDFARFAPGSRIVMRNASPKNNVNFSNTSKIMMFEVTGDAFDPSNNAVPSVLRPDNPAMTVQPAESVATRVLKLYRANGSWTINGHTWDTVQRSGFNFVEWSPKEHSVEVWEIWNDSGGWFHPTHIHLVDFRILSRNGKAPFAYERGPKDVVYVGENERVKLLMRFDGCGKYMIHCHNLRHEDHDMMSQFEVLSDTPMDSPLSAPAMPITQMGSL
jgi:spore coat protein A, manganese oxidase